MKDKYFIILIALVINFFNCQRDEIYEEEQFNEHFKSIFGTWNSIKDKYGNWPGMIITHKAFDQLIIQDNSEYQIIYDSIVIEEGKIKILNQSDSLLRIEFQFKYYNSDSKFFPILKDRELYVIINQNDRLNLYNTVTDYGSVSYWFERQV
jgi:hypothetical protein